MNVYEVDIWQQVQHNGQFSHTVTRTEIVHALNEKRARAKIILAKPKTWDSSSMLKIEAQGEFIYGIAKRGTVTKQMYYEYSDRNLRPRPVGGK